LADGVLRKSSLQGAFGFEKLQLSSLLEQALCCWAISAQLGLFPARVKTMQQADRRY
jgi:hypothetical protein